MTTPRKTPKTRVLARVPVVNLMDDNVEPSDAALRSLMSSVEASVVAKNAATTRELQASLRVATSLALVSFGMAI